MMKPKIHPVVPVAVFAALVAAAVAWACPLLTTDTCCRYAPMAEAFAAGDWATAFHPRFCLGMPAVAGTFRYLTGIDGYRACTMVSSVAWALGIVPLFFLARRVFDTRTAWFAVVLYLGGPTIAFWGMKGLREPFKVLGILLAADALFGCRTGGWRNLAEASAGLALLLFFKVDAVAIGLLFAAAYLCADRFRLRGLILLGEAVLFLQPVCLLVYDWTGKWVPAVECASAWQRIMGA